MKKISIIVIILASIGLWLLVTKKKDPSLSEKAGDSFTVVTSFYPLAFALENIVGDTGTVINIGEGHDPHDFQPSTQDIAKLYTADLVVLQGAGLEPWGEDIHEQLEKENVPVIMISNGLTLKESSDSDKHDSHEEESLDSHNHEDDSTTDSELHEHDSHDHGIYDPHTWVDPVTYAQTVDYLITELSRVNPELAETYTSNGNILLNKLATLSQEYKEKLNSCMYREVIVSHNAFSYLADQYNFTTHAIAGLSTQDQPSSTTLTELKNEASEGKIGAILLEENNITKYGEILSKETGLPSFPINPIAFNVKKSEDYISISRLNLATLVQALKCS